MSSTSIDYEFQQCVYITSSFRTFEDDSIKIFVLYKLATCGPCLIESPGRFYADAHRYWLAWKQGSNNYIDTQSAKLEFIDYVKKSGLYPSCNLLTQNI